MSLRYGILGLIHNNPQTGYELKNKFDNTINFFWSAKQSQIYRELSKLKEEGYIEYIIEEQVSKPNKKIYSITEKGKEQFNVWLNSFPETLHSPLRDEFLMRIFFGSNLSKDELSFQLKKYIKEMERVRSILIYLMDQNDKSKKMTEEEKFYKNLTIKKGILFTEASTKWADECIVEISQYKINIMKDDKLRT